MNPLTVLLFMAVGSSDNPLKILFFVIVGLIVAIMVVGFVVLGEAMAHAVEDETWNETDE